MEERTAGWEKANTMHVSKAHSFRDCRRRFLGLRQVQVQWWSSIVPLCVGGWTFFPRKQGLSNLLSVCQKPQNLCWISGSADCQCLPLFLQNYLCTFPEQGGLRLSSHSTSHWYLHSPCFSAVFLNVANHLLSPSVSVKVCFY